MKVEYTPEEEVVVKRPAKFKAIKDDLKITIEHGVVSLFRRVGYLAGSVNDEWDCGFTMGLDDLQKFMKAYEEKVNEEK